MFKNYERTIFILIGLQACGKTTFCERYFSSERQISLDAVKTRKREDELLAEAFRAGGNIVVDNTNVSKAERAKYILLAKEHNYKVVGLYFRSALTEAFARNSLRAGRANVPKKALLSAAKRLEQPSYQECFDELFYIKIENEIFIISKWSE